jgi:RNA polymerase sigma factor (sigma-70 family)
MAVRRVEHRPDILRAVEGDTHAIDAVARYAGVLALRTASGLFGNREEARDIAQDVAIDVLRQLGKLRDPDKFEAWVHQITRRRAMRAIRIRRMRWQKESADLETLSLSAPQESLAHRIALEQAMRKALQRLPAKQQFAFVLRHVHDLTDAHIADAMGCSANTAASHLFRARKALRADPDLRAYWSDEEGETS